MAVTIFEIFNCQEGAKLGLRHGEKRARETVARLDGAKVEYKKTGLASVFDYAPAKEEGFFVVDMGDNVKAGPFASRDAAERKASFEDMASDTNSFRVVEHRI